MVMLLVKVMMMVMRSSGVVAVVGVRVGVVRC